MLKVTLLKRNRRRWKNKSATHIEVTDSEYVDLINVSRYWVQSAVLVNKVINYQNGLA
jgi:hypothetical protein